jgi:ABC-type multidrug transport system ATPase subunit
MIWLKDIIKSYGKKPVLREISFEARPGQITLLIGANGAGKSTTIKVLAGLTRPNAGQAWVNQVDIVKQRIAAQRTLSYLPQRPSFHPRMTCGEIVRFYARLRNVEPSRYHAALELAGLREFESVRTGELSGGTRQRLGLALLLLPDAPVLLLDEPGLSLDPGWRMRLQSTLRFEADRGKTVLVTTHLVREWNEIADRCLLCREGRIDRELDPSALPDNFEDLQTPSASPFYEPRFSIAS